MMNNNLQQKDVGRHPEAVANKYTIRGMTIVILVLCIMLIGNLLGWFPFDTKLFVVATTVSVTFYGIGCLVLDTGYWILGIGNICTLATFISSPPSSP